MPSIDASEPLRLWIREKWRKIWTKRSLMGLLLGQFVSLLITSTGFSSSELARRGVNAPTSQSFLNYLLLAVFYGVFVIRRQRPLQVLRSLPGIASLLIALKCPCALARRSLLGTELELGRMSGDSEPGSGSRLLEWWSAGAYIVGVVDHSYLATRLPLWLTLSSYASYHARRPCDMWSHLAKPFTADLRHVGCSNPHFCVSPKVSIKEQDKQEDEEAAIGNLTRGSTAAVENQSSGVVNQQLSSLTSLPK
ncbi:hypothetical protein GW17_00011731 [Ensete ventricosum]|nr:hypothetical protein GW17_00011731 [Ensete ventricosum]